MSLTTLSSHQTPDAELLGQFAATGSPEAFRQLVDCHLPMVHAAAVRILRRMNPPLAHHADDVAQSVFILLAGKAARISSKISLAGWLYRVTHYACRNLRRLESARIRRERESAAMHSIQDSAKTSEAEVLLDAALLSLPERDRGILLLRYGQNLSIQEVARMMQATPESTKQRLHRALEKLRAYFAAHGMPSSTGLALHALSCQPLSNSLALSVTTNALAAAKGTLAACSGLTLAKAASKAMAALKIKLATACAVLLVLICAGVILVSQHAFAQGAAPPKLVSAGGGGAVGLPGTVPQAAATATKPAFADWVHMRTQSSRAGAVPVIKHWSTQTNTIVQQAAGNVTYENPKTGENLSYLSASRVLQIADLDPNFLTNYFAEAAAPPLTYPELLGPVRAKVGADGMSIVESTDGGMLRYELSLTAKALARPVRSMARSSVFNVAVPSVIWVDPATKLIQKMKTDQEVVTFTYGAPGFASIYEAGVPRDAKVVDYRPAAEAKAVYERVMARVRPPMPDGVLVSSGIMTNPSDKNGVAQVSVSLEWRAGAEWGYRSYSDAGLLHSPHGPMVPAVWDEQSTAEFFKRVAAAMPDGDFHSDGKSASGFQYDRATGGQFHTGVFPTALDSRGSVVGRNQPVAGPHETAGRDEETGREALSFGTFWDTFLMGNGLYSPGGTLELATAPDHPGEIALCVRFHGAAPEKGTVATYWWMDPAHGDRLVECIDNDPAIAITDPAQSDGQGQMVTEFGDYVQLPAPDGRWYPTSVTESIYMTDDRGKKEYRSLGKTAYHFIAGKVVPALPAQPATAR